jgi:hypothetical protein
MEDEDFEKYFGKIEELYIMSKYFTGGTRLKRKQKLKEIIEEIYQKGKDDKFKDIGYLDVDEFYPDEKEAKP